MPVKELSWSTIHLHGDAWLQHHRLRKEVFIERMGWGVPSANGLEYDQYDTPAAKYLLSLDDAQKVVAAVRLMSTTRSYMAADLWPEMFDGPSPRDPRIWEITRFCSSSDLSATERAEAVTEIIEAIQIFGLRRRISHFIAVMPLAMFNRSIKRAGCAYELTGEPLLIDKRRTGLAKIPVSRENLHSIRVTALARRMRQEALAREPATA